MFRLAVSFLIIFCQVNRHVQQLSLYNCAIGTAGAASLAAALEVFPMNFMIDFIFFSAIVQ